jgi:pimeloyl-ACP methyl ester carboxylesterase
MGSIFGRPTIGRRKKGFLVRTRKDFAKHSLMVAVVDIPSDQKPTQNPMVGIHPTFRMSNEHAQDIKAVSSYLKKEANIPVWLIGMCMGTFSAANGGIRINEGIDGLVFLSSYTRPPKSSRFSEINPNGIINMSLNMVKVPTLIIAHKDDKCRGTPPSDALKIKKELANSPLVEVKYFIGGKAPMSKPCQALSAHGFYGIEEQVIAAIADFIKSYSK